MLALWLRQEQVSIKGHVEEQCPLSLMGAFPSCDHVTPSETGQIQKASGPTFYRHKCPWETDPQERRGAVRAEEAGGVPS